MNIKTIITTIVCLSLLVNNNAFCMHKWAKNAFVIATTGSITFLSLKCYREFKCVQELEEMNQKRINKEKYQRNVKEFNKIHRATVELAALIKASNGTIGEEITSRKACSLLTPSVIEYFLRRGTNVEAEFIEHSNNTNWLPRVGLHSKEDGTFVAEKTSIKNAIRQRHELYKKLKSDENSDDDIICKSTVIAPHEKCVTNITSNLCVKSFEDVIEKMEEFTNPTPPEELDDARHRLPNSLFDFAFRKTHENQ